MSTFVLIFFIKHASAGGLTSVEFTSLEACNAAKAQVLDQWEKEGWVRTSAFAVCVQK